MDRRRFIKRDLVCGSPKENSGSEKQDKKYNTEPRPQSGTHRTAAWEKSIQNFDSGACLRKAQSKDLHIQSYT